MKTARFCKKTFVILLTMVLAGAFWSAAGADDTTDGQLLTMLQRNCVPQGYDRCPELYLVYRPDVLTSSSEDSRFACSHGFPWPADTRIPLILYGRGIAHGRRIGDVSASLEDIAPTLAALIGTPPPETANGRVLFEALVTRRPGKTSRGHARGQKSAPAATLVFTLDQCRADYLTNPQISPAFAFTRSVLMTRGASYADARLSYAGSRTAVSHTVIGTGATPGGNGIIGNNIRLGDQFPLAYNGTPRHSMEMFNLLAPTLADVVDLALGNRPVVIAMSPYGRAALGMAGHGAAYMADSDRDIVLKLSRDTGLPYTNADYFRLPAYLTRSDANPVRIDEWLAAYYGVDIHHQSWTERTVIEDRSPYAPPHHHRIVGPQGVFPDGTEFSFSHAAVTAGQTAPTSTTQLWDPSVGYPVNTYFEEALYTPFYTLWATDLLLETMAREAVGQDAITDLVYYNFKCIDKLGHRYGVDSPEIYTYLYTVDYCLRKIKHFLDRRVGPDRYTMVVTADHGGHNAYDDRILYNRDLFDAIEGRFGTGVILNNPDDGDPFDDMIYLDRDMLTAAGVDLSNVADFVETTFGPWVHRAYTIDEIFAP